MHTHIQCFIQSESSMINELYPSLKGSLDLLFTEFRELSSGVIVLHSKDVALVRLGWGQTVGADKLPGNCNTLWVLTEHNKHVGHVTWRLGPTEPQLSVYCLVFHCSPVKMLSPSEYLSDILDLRCPRSHWLQSAKCHFSIVNKQMSASPRPSVRWPGLTQY